LAIIEHPGNYKTYYAHLSAYNPELSVGSEVRRGLEIGYVGSTGHSTGPHLHFELRKNNTYLNPLSNGLELDLWTLNSADQYELTNNILLFSTIIN
jgi:murein DD-endopeptidase MepM/ murein hydrolase activator NlpD